tara:strand:- start:1466 stop:1846 length:381 start_codon:yes stop_codon:yes gene_type:complete
MSKLIEIVKNIILTKEPNKITSYYVDFKNYDNNYNYINLLKYWKEESKKNNSNEILKEYENINKFDNKNIGIFSIFYFKNQNNFLAFGKYYDELFYLDVKCLQYSKIFDEVIEQDNELYVLSYWIL